MVTVQRLAMMIQSPKIIPLLDSINPSNLILREGPEFAVLCHEDSGVLPKWKDLSMQFFVTKIAGCYPKVYLGLAVAPEPYHYC